MPENDRNWIGWSIDLVRTWRAKGGGFAFASGFFGVFTLWVEGVPALLPPALLLMSVGAACLASYRAYRILWVGGTGRRVDGTIGGFEKRNYFDKATKNSRMRALYVYEIEGQSHQGYTSWAHPVHHKKRFGDLVPGNRIALAVDPKRLRWSAPLAEVPHLGGEVR